LARAVVVVAMCAACQREAPAPVAPQGPTIELVLDDGAPRTISVDGVLPLATLIATPPATWLEVHGEATDDRELQLDGPARRYPGSEVRVYLEQGRPALGVFPPVTPDMPPEVAALARQPSASLTALARVHVVTKRTVLPGLIVVDGTREVAVASDQLVTLAGTPRGASRAQGWALADVIGLVRRTAGIQTIQILGAGDPITLAGSALRDATQIFGLKQNQRGEYVFRVWAADGRRPSRELRRVTKIVVD
jgi:hypothetical protein